MDDFRDIVRDDGAPILARHDGFVTFHFVKVDDFNAIVIIIWKDIASAQAGAKSFGPTWFATHFKPFLASTEDRSGGEILVTMGTLSE